MHSEPVNSQYQQALSLAESGQYEQALNGILSYLESNPTDAQALNDTGTILYCLGQGEKAIHYLEKAMRYACQDQREQICWNLCEAYISESCPEKAMELFEKMRSWGILNADTVNRTANIFLKQNNIGRAMEALSLSTRLWSDQKVLQPMIDILHAKRCKTVIFSDRDRPVNRMLAFSLNKWMPTECCIGAQDEQIRTQIQSADISVFIGCGVSLVFGLNAKTHTKKIVIIDEQDIYGPMIGLLNQSPLDAVIVCACPQAIEDLRQRTGHSYIIEADPVPEAAMLTPYEKQSGLRIAAVGPWNLRNNPMFLLQCFQKLNYIHPDSRLYLAGVFEDPGLEHYLQHLTEAMDLENKVFFDGPVKNWAKWFKDKQCVVSTAVDSSAMAGVWMGMACGLRPVVHRFAGVKRMLDERFIFDYSEQFCKQVESDDYQPGHYRQIVCNQFEQSGLALKLHAVICELEEKIKSVSQPDHAVSPAADADLRPSTPTVPSAPNIPYQSLCAEIDSIANTIGAYEGVN